MGIFDGYFRQLTIEAVSASGRKFRLFVIGNSSGPAGDVWGGLEKPDGTIVKYEGGFDADSGALALKHQARNFD